MVQSIGTFFVVSAVFSVVFLIAGIPIDIAFVFGGIALATAESFPSTGISFTIPSRICVANVIGEVGWLPIRSQETTVNRR